MVITWACPFAVIMAEMKVMMMQLLASLDKKSLEKGCGKVSNIAESFGVTMMAESISEYHRRRSAEEKSEAEIHADDITAEQHRRLAIQHKLLARKAESAERARGKRPPP